MSETTPLPDHVTDHLVGVLTSSVDAHILSQHLGESGGLVEDVDQRPSAPPSPTALVTDTWTREQGAKLIDEWKALGLDASFGLMDEDAAIAAAANQGGGQNITLGPGLGRAKHAKNQKPNAVAIPAPPPKVDGAPSTASLADVAKLKDGAHIAADTFTALFEATPHLAPHPADEKRARYMADVLQGQEYMALHRRTAHQVELARIGAGSLALQYAAYAQAEAQRNGNGDGDPDPNSPEGIAEEARRMRSVRRAINSATQDVDAAEQAAAGLGGADDVSKLGPAELAKVARLAASDRILRAILQAAGRYRTRARTLQTERLDAPRGFITGVTLSGDLSLALAAERAAVGGAVPELELLAQYRFATGRLLSYSHKARTPVAAGPIIISVDESGSMSGEPIICAKGIALAMAWVARAQKRPCLLSAFADGPEIRTCAAELPPGLPKTPPEQIADWCTTFINGGTTADGPLETIRGSEYVKLDGVKGRTDHIIITDAQLSVDEAMIAAYNAWAKAFHVRTFVIVIGAGAEVGDMARVATRSWCVSDLSLSQGAVEAALSIGPE